jgi:hypothetical protein
VKKWLLPGLLLLSLVGAYVAMPWYSAQQIVQAARSDDTEKLASYIDFPSLRGNLKTHLQQRLRDSLGDSLPQELGGLFTAGTDLFIGPLLEQWITPEGIRDLLQGRRDLQQLEERVYGERSGQRQTEPAVGENAKDRRQSWRLQNWHFTDLNHVAADCGEGDTAQLRLILQRQGLRWRLVDIRLLQN